MLCMLYRKKAHQDERLMTGFTAESNMDELCSQMAEETAKSLKESDWKNVLSHLNSYENLYDESDWKQAISNLSS